MYNIIYSTLPIIYEIYGISTQYIPRYTQHTDNNVLFSTSQPLTLAARARCAN